MKLLNLKNGFCHIQKHAVAVGGNGQAKEVNDERDGLVPNEFTHKDDHELAALEKALGK